MSLIITQNDKFVIFSLQITLQIFTLKKSMYICWAMARIIGCWFTTVRTCSPW